MYKSLIFTFTIATLSSVAYCQYRVCNNGEEVPCKNFCDEASKEYEFVTCAKPYTTQMCYGARLKGYPVGDRDCRDGIKNTCSDFFHTVPHGGCNCKGASINRCRVKVG